MKKNSDSNKPLEINPTTLIQLDPDAIEGVVGGKIIIKATQTSDSCDRCTHCPRVCDTDV